jgi:CRP-like cAMP-binding protein
MRLKSTGMLAYEPGEISSARASKPMDVASLPNASALSLRNRLLRLLPHDELRRLLSICRPVEINPRQVLHHWRMPMQHVYFVERGLVSVAARIGENRFVEVWLVGSEGMVGGPIVLGNDDEPPHRRVVQVGGTPLKASASEFRSILQELPGLRNVLQRYAHVVLLQTSQSGACNAHHSLRQRLCRWLLLAHDALGTDELRLTHEVLARLLGVRRASVTECLDVFRSEGMLKMQRGALLLADPRKLQAATATG